MNNGLVVGYLSDIVLYFILFAILHKFYRCPYCYYRKRIFYATVLIILFCCFAFFDSDYYGYLNDFTRIFQYGKTRTSLEDFYTWLIPLTSGNYFIFRLLIWGSATILLVQTFKIANIGIGITLFFFVVMNLNIFAYGRVSLVFSILFLSLAFLLSNKKGTFKKFIAVALLFGALFLHKSAAFGVAIVISAWMLRKAKRDTMFLFILCIPILIGAATMFIEYLQTTSNQTTLLDFNSAKGYLSSALVKSGIGAIIRKILVRTPYYLTAYVYVYSVLQKQNVHWPILVNCFGMASFMIVVSASLFLFIDNVNADTLYYRFLYYSIIPNSVLLAYCYRIRFMPRLVSLALSIGVTGVIYSLIYGFYNLLLGANMMRI